MNILAKYTRRSLSRNKTRTLVTIIGIVLSMALFTAVIEGAWSGLSFLIRAEVETSGRYMVIVPAETAEKRQRLAADGRIKSYALVWEEDADVEGTDYVPSLATVTEDYPALSGLKLISGRYPEKAGEVIVPDSWLSDMRDAVSEEYTIVGTYKHFFYTAITFGESYGYAEAWVELKNPAEYESFAKSYGEEFLTHRMLLVLYGAAGSNNLRSFLFGFTAILVGLIMFGSISLIYNSFSISVADRTREFGILKSVGATKKQIRRSVLYEALVLSAAAIPIGLIVGCAGIGITLYLLRDAFGAFTSVKDVEMRLEPNPLALSIAAAICLVTTLISAWIPALRAMRTPPMEAIRQTADVKIREREIKTSRLTAKLFGFEGTMAAKNFKRSRRRYRSTVISLFLSIVLFISASSFCAYLTDAVEMGLANDTGEDIYYRTYGSDMPDPEGLFAKLITVEGMEDGWYFTKYWLHLETEALNADPSVSVVSGDMAYWSGRLVFLRDEEFRALCSENGEDPEDYFDPAAPRALILNEYTYEIFTDNGKYYMNARFLNEAKLPAPVYFEAAKGIEGYFFAGYADDETCCYVPVELTGSGEGYDLDDERILRVPASEAITRQELTVTRALKTRPMGLGGTDIHVILPWSMSGFVVHEDYYDTEYVFKASQHAKAAEDMRELLQSLDLESYTLQDKAADEENMRMLSLVINVMAYGFIILISLIAAANVFNTISTSIGLRRREFAMLRSIGMGNRSFMRMLRYECAIYGAKALLWGLPAAAIVTYGIYTATNSLTEQPFYIPPVPVAIAVFSVFAVVFATMLYSAAKIRKDNPIDALKNENL